MAIITAAFCFALFLMGCGNSTSEPTTSRQGEQAPIVPPSPSTEKGPPPAPRWQTYHGNTTLDGVADVELPDTLAQAWKFDAGAAIANPPVVGRDRICFANAKGVIFGLDLGGRQVWTKSFTGPAGEGTRTVYFDAPLVLIDGTLIAGSANGTVYALDAATGDVRWQCDTKLPILGSPNVADVVVDGGVQKRVFVIDEGEGALQSIDFATGKLLWTGKGVSRCDGSPAVNGSIVVYGSCAAALHMFDARDGKLLRETPLDDDSQVAGGVVLLGSSIYSGSRSGIFIHANAETGAAEWINKDCEGESFSTPAVNADSIVYGANDAMLYCLDRKTGTLRWKQKLEDTPASPVIARDKVVVTAGGELYLMRLSDGGTVWSYSVSDVVTSPAVVAGPLVLIGADDGSLTAFGAGKDA